jgi:DNA-binding response OmpR family regulator
MSSQQKLKILIIDDNENITKMFKKFFELKGWDCIVSNNGRNGLTLMEEQKFDAVVLDLSMPDFTGYDVIDELEKKDLVKKQKLVVLTATAITNAKIKELMEKGVSACLKKPANLNEVISAIRGS